MMALEHCTDKTGLRLTFEKAVFVGKSMIRKTMVDSAAAAAKLQCEPKLEP
jgi:hypothetical protein